MIQKRKIIVSVTNDLVSDQRVNKVCCSLLNHFSNIDILLVGCEFKGSLPLKERPYRLRRLNLYFESGFLFYAEYNIRLFLLLVFSHSDILIANDLDTLLPNYFVSKLKGTKLVYDSHEYFTELPELLNRKRVRGVWQMIESFIFPKLKTVFTVNDSLAKIYSEKYSVKVNVIRNLPYRNQMMSDKNHEFFRNDIGIENSDKVIIYQGALNIDRGLEELIMASQFLSSNVKVLIAGKGKVMDELIQLTKSLKLDKRVFFLGSIPFDQLHFYTCLADIGVSLEKDTNLNYKFALPNKLFDYMSAGLAILASSLPEIRKVVEENNIGQLLDLHEPKHIAEKLELMLNSDDLEFWKQNSEIAANKFCWELEEGKLVEVYKNLLE